MIEIVLTYLILGAVYTTSVLIMNNVVKVHGFKAAVEMWFLTFGVWPMAFMSLVRQWMNKK